MSAQMCFSGSAGCPSFEANQFKADICKLCSNKIQNHSSATESQIRAALEFSVDKLPSLILRKNGGSLYIGGYKSAVNLNFLKSSNIQLVINTAKGLENVLGPRFEKQKLARANQFPSLVEKNSNLLDDLHQFLPFQEFEELTQLIEEYLNRGSSVIVHCAQGKSRSVALVVFYLLRTEGLSAEDALKLIKSKRMMAEPNPNFMNQLIKYQQENQNK